MGENPDYICSTIKKTLISLCVFPIVALIIGRCLLKKILVFEFTLLGLLTWLGYFVEERCIFRLRQWMLSRSETTLRKRHLDQSSSIKMSAMTHVAIFVQQTWKALKRKTNIFYMGVLLLKILYIWFFFDSNYKKSQSFLKSYNSRCIFSVLLRWANAIKVWANAIKCPINTNTNKNRFLIP